MSTPIRRSVSITSAEIGWPIRCEAAKIGFSCPRGYTRQWEALRAEFLRLHPACAFCGSPAEHIDHIKRHRGDPALVLNWNNLQSFCAHCHNSVKQRQERARDV